MHDGSRSEGEQKEEEDDGVAVVQYPSSLWARDRKKHKGCCFQLQCSESAQEYQNTYSVVRRNGD